MGITDLWNDVVESLLPTVALAEEEEPEDDAPADDAEGEEEEKEDGEDEDEDDDDDDDDDDEPEDPLPKVQEEAENGPCKEFKHHFEECAERVQKEMEEPGYADKENKEDCVEEFFHVRHCIDQHVAPTFFSKHTK